MSILVGRDTRLVVQGITGREGEFHSRAMLEYGTQVIAGVTMNPAKILNFPEKLGTLEPGVTADVAILELRTGTFEFQDNFNNRITRGQRLFPSGTVLAGTRVQG